MVQIKNTNLNIKNNAYILEYCVNGTPYGERITVICYDLKNTLKKYKDMYLFGSPIQYLENYGFIALRKNFKPKTRNSKKLVIGNALYFINKAVNENKLNTEY